MKFRKFVLAIIALFIVALVIPSSSESISEIMGDLKWTLNDNGELVIFGNGEMEYKYLCGDKTAWKKYSDQIKKVIIQEGVTSIGIQAFRGCDRIVSVSILGSVTKIGSEAFRGCSSLKNIIIPGTIVIIENQTFMDCSSLNEINIPDSVAGIGSAAFKNCVSLKRVIMPASISKIAKDAFDNCVPSRIPLAYTKEIFEQYYNRVADYCFYVTEGSCAEEYIKKSGYTFDNGNSKVLDIRVQELQKADLVVAECVKSDMSEKEKARVLHDWLIRNAYYGGVSETGSLLLSGTGFCGDYAWAYQLLLTRAGLANMSISGYANSVGHFWNLVRIDGKWFHVDPTYDDPSGSQRKTSGNETSRYFMMTDEQIKKDHSWDETSYSVDVGFFRSNYYNPD